MRLNGKTALITGAGSGFGAEIARRFAAQRARVYLADIDGAAADRVALECGGHGLAADISVEADVKAMIAAACAEAPLDILVNNAGITHPPGDLDAVSDGDFDRVFAVNCKSVFLTAREVVPMFKQAGAGVILNIASTAGVRPRPKLAWYCASKGWMITATRAMAIELAPHRVRVNAINPVAADTPLLPSFMGGNTPELRAQFVSSIPLGRFATPGDIAEAAVYLCSDEASLVTGLCMEVDGGRSI